MSNTKSEFAQTYPANIKKLTALEARRADLQGKISSLGYLPNVPQSVLEEAWELEKKLKPIHTKMRNLAKKMNDLFVAAGSPDGYPG